MANTTSQSQKNEVLEGGLKMAEQMVSFWGNNYAEMQKWGADQLNRAIDQSAKVMHESVTLGNEMMSSWQHAANTLAGKATEVLKKNV